jgi:putative ABC transport system permease protein
MVKQNFTPPKLFHRLFRWYCHPRLRAGIEGDMIELYGERRIEKGKRSADMQFAKDVVLLFRPGIIKQWKPNFNENTMIRNYVKISWRNIVKNKTFSAINVFGLAIGLAACLLIFEFVAYEFSFDRFHSKLERTYRITNDRFQNGKLIQHGTITYPTIGPTMASEFPEIEDYARIMPVGDLNVKIGDKNFRGDQGIFADQRLLRVFDFQLKAGNRATLLKDPYTIAITENTARKFFEYQGDNLSSLIGKTFLWGLDSRPYEVKGILANLPANSHLQFDALISYSTLTVDDPGADNSWTWSDMYHYLVLKPGVDPDLLAAKFPSFSQRHFDGTKVSGSLEKFYLQPLKNAHLYSDYEYDIAYTASGKAVWSMLIVAVFILIIAWINYINLTTSRGIDRAKEVGLRKVMGAFKGQLVRQFIFETIVLTLIASLITVVIITVLQPSFNEIVGSDLSWSVLIQHTTPNQLLIVAAILIGGAITAGFYPAFILSKYQPATVLKGRFTKSGKGNFLRKSLVIFQFSTSAALICGTLIVSRQIEYMNTADLGINLKNVLVVQPPEMLAFDSTFIGRVEEFKNELSNISGVVHATTSWRLPGDRLGRAFNIRVDGQPHDLQYTVSHMGVDYDYFHTMQINLLAGREFTPADHNPDFGKLKSIIINKNALKLFGFETPQDAIGREVFWGGENGTRKWTIVGVMNDYHQEALQKPMEPIVFRPAYSTNSPISIKINTTDKAHLLSMIESAYKKFFPGNSFDHTFLQDRYNNQYSDDKRFGKIVSIFTILAIIVACLGLIGLSSYTAVLRTKEIGIRKALGASVANIVSLLSMDFVRLVVIASLLSLPVAYVIMNKWLESYSYRIDLGWALFVAPLLIVVIIAALTICFQVIKTAMTKPVDTLKYE